MYLTEQSHKSNWELQVAGEGASASVVNNDLAIYS